MLGHWPFPWTLSIVTMLSFNESFQQQQRNFHSVGVNTIEFLDIYFFFAAICLSDPIQCIVAVYIQLLNLFVLTVADTTKRITRDFQVLDEETGVARRSLIVIDKRGEIRYWSVLQHHEIEHNFDSVLSLVRTLLFHFVSK